MLLFCNNNNRENVKLRNEGKWSRRSGFISESTEYMKHDDIITHPKTEQEVNLIRTALEGNEFLANILHEKQLKHLIDCMYFKEIKEGEILIREDEKGSHLYISNTGVYEVTIKETFVHMFDDVRVFGELAILYSGKRHATIESLSSGSVWVLDCRTFKKLIVKTAIEEQEEMVSFLEQVPPLNTTSKEKLYQVANLLKVEYFAAFKEIVTQGKVCDKFYIVRVGSVTVLKNNNEIAKLGRGKFFGEIALLEDELRQATVIAGAHGAECLTLTRKHFIDHFGEVEEFVNLKAHTVYPEKVIECTELILEDFNKLATLGIGGFGKVELIQHTRYKDNIFALKSLRKMEIIGRSHQDQVYNEKNIQMACNSPFIVKLYRTYKDSKHVYLLMEACLGGDLWTLLHRQRKHCVEESAAKFYSGCVLEALSYLHARNIIYRDLKPENIMIHHNGYLKLTDFGFSKRIDSKEKTYTFVGTAEYVAPELILNKGYTKGVDYWAFGVLIYELLVGKTPFRTNDPDHLKTYKRILKGIDHAVFPYHVSSRAKALIKKLCMYISSDRLGCQRGGITDIKEHPWFSSINWYQLNNFMIEPPYKPTLLSSVDTKYFEKCENRNNTKLLEDFSSWDNDF